MSGSRGPLVAMSVVILCIGAVLAMGFWAIFEDRSEPADIVGIAGRSNSSELLVRVQHLSCESNQPDVRVDESDSAIVLGARYDTSGDCDDVFRESEVTVVLDDPLDSRRIESQRVNEGSTQVCLIDDAPSTQCSQP